MVYPEWHLPLKNSMDLPTKGVFEPALVVVDGKCGKRVGMGWPGDGVGMVVGWG
jgi:hypothetical protein